MDEGILGIETKLNKSLMILSEEIDALK